MEGEPREGHGRKHFLALDTGFRESAESWKAVLLSLRDRGVKGGKLAVQGGCVLQDFSNTHNEIRAGLDILSAL